MDKKMMAAEMTLSIESRCSIGYKSEVDATFWRTNMVRLASFSWIVCLFVCMSLRFRDSLGSKENEKKENWLITKDAESVFGFKPA